MAFGAYTRYYDLLYRNKAYGEEASYIERLIKRSYPEAHSILELGCGTGIHASLLAKLGFEVHGIDISVGMLKQANARLVTFPEEVSKRLSFARGDVRTYRYERQFDAVISLFHVASYQTTNEDLSDFIATAARHLHSGGTFIFDFWYGPAVLTARPEVRVKRLEDDASRILRIAEPELLVNENRVDVNYEIWVTDKTSGETEQIREVHPMRYMFLPELGQLLERQGFSCWQAEEWLTGGAPGLNTWGVCITAKK